MMFFIQSLWHDLPNLQNNRNTKTIVLIRDPRDTIWAQYNSEPLPINFLQAVNHYQYARAWNSFYEHCLKLHDLAEWIAAS
jgi:hypothetical protein